MSTALKDALDLVDWRRRVFAIYAEVRAATSPEEAWGRWKEARDRLFKEHPQSPLTDEVRQAFGRLEYFPYDPGQRVDAEITEVEPESYDVPTSGDESFAFIRVGRTDFVLEGSPLTLEIYRLEGYAGGLFLPFRDATSGHETYGAGRYLYDTIKGADLGTKSGRLILDFNFAYNPSCSYNPRWVCPLSPPANRLGREIRAGEKHSS